MAAEPEKVQECFLPAEEVKTTLALPDEGKGRRGSDANRRVSLGSLMGKGIVSGMRGFWQDQTTTTLPKTGVVTGRAQPRARDKLNPTVQSLPSDRLLFKLTDNDTPMEEDELQEECPPSPPSTQPDSQAQLSSPRTTERKTPKSALKKMWQSMTGRSGKQRSATPDDLAGPRFDTPPSSHGAYESTTDQPASNPGSPADALLSKGSMTPGASDGQADGPNTDIARLIEHAGAAVQLVVSPSLAQPCLDDIPENEHDSPQHCQSPAVDASASASESVSPVQGLPTLDERSASDAGDDGYASADTSGADGAGQQGAEAEQMEAEEQAVPAELADCAGEAADGDLMVVPDAADDAADDTAAESVPPDSLVSAGMDAAQLPGGDEDACMADAAATEAQEHLADAPGLTADAEAAQVSLDEASVPGEVGHAERGALWLAEAQSLGNTVSSNGSTDGSASDAHRSSAGLEEMGMEFEMAPGDGAVQAQASLSDVVPADAVEAASEDSLSPAVQLPASSASFPAADECGMDMEEDAVPARDEQTLDTLDAAAGVAEDEGVAIGVSSAPASPSAASASSPTAAAAPSPVHEDTSPDAPAAESPAQTFPSGDSKPEAEQAAHDSDDVLAAAAANVAAAAAVPFPPSPLPPSLFHLTQSQAVEHPTSKRSSSPGAALSPGLKAQDSFTCGSGAGDDDNVTTPAPGLGLFANRSIAGYPDGDTHEFDLQATSPPEDSPTTSLTTAAAAIAAAVASPVAGVIVSPAAAGLQSPVTALPVTVADADVHMMTPAPALSYGTGAADQPAPAVGADAAPSPAFPGLDTDVDMLSPTPQIGRTTARVSSPGGTAQGSSNVPGLFGGMYDQASTMMMMTPAPGMDEFIKPALAAAKASSLEAVTAPAATLLSATSEAAFEPTAFGMLTPSNSSAMPADQSPAALPAVNVSMCADSLVSDLMAALQDVDDTALQHIRDAANEEPQTLDAPTLDAPVPNEFIDVDMEDVTGDLMSYPTLDAQAASTQVPPLENTPSPVSSAPPSPKVTIQVMRESIPLFVRDSLMVSDSVSLERQSLASIEPFGRSGAGMASTARPAGLMASMLTLDTLDEGAEEAHDGEQPLQAMGKLSKGSSSGGGGGGGASQARSTQLQSLAEDSAEGAGSAQKRGTPGAAFGSPAVPARGSPYTAATTPDLASMPLIQKGSGKTPTPGSRRINGPCAAPHPPSTLKPNATPPATRSLVKPAIPGPSLSPTLPSIIKPGGLQTPAAAKAGPVKPPAAGVPPIPASWATPLAQMQQLPFDFAVNAPLLDGSPFPDLDALDTTNIAEEASRMALVLNRTTDSNMPTPTLMPTAHKHASGTGSSLHAASPLAGMMDLSSMGSGTSLLSTPITAQQPSNSISPGAAGLLEAQNAMLMDRLLAAEQRSAAAEKQVEQLKDQISTMSFGDELLQAGAGDMERDARLCAEEQLQAANTQLNVLQETTRHLQASLTDKQSSLDQAQASIATLTEQLAAKEAELHSSNQALAAANTQVCSLQESAHLSQSQLSECSKELDLTRQRYQALQADVARLRQARDEAQASLNRSADELIAERLRSKQQVTASAAEVSALRSALDKYKADKEALKQELGNMQLSQATMQAKYKQELAALAGERDKLQNERNQLVTIAEQLMGSLEQAQGKTGGSASVPTLPK